MNEKQYPFASMLQGQQVIPVATLENEDQAKGVSEALLAGGVHCVEITLRTKFAVSAIDKIRAFLPEMLVIAGTVTTKEEYKMVCDAGAQAVVSPGISSDLISAALNYKVPFMPGVGTASEIMAAMTSGFHECKLFPFNIVGGASAIKAFSGPFPSIKFCPTGGVTSSNFAELLKLESVIAVGGSWLVPKEALFIRNWDLIKDIAKECVASQSLLTTDKNNQFLSREV